jgi:hypothetical protein
MSKNTFLAVIFLVISNFSIAQAEKEIAPPYNIKAVSFVQNGQNNIPMFLLNDGFQLQFDDLYGDEANYYYQIVHCDYDWKRSQLSPAEYIQGFDDQRIQEYYNSFNTLQLYSHYKLTFPNKFTRFLVSGNYLLKIVNEAKEVVFSRKFVLFEDLVSVPIQVKRARNLKDVNAKQNLDFAIKSQNIQFQNPIQNIRITLIKNGQFSTAINNVKPMFTIGNDLIYKYDVETQFWGGNEFLNFENKNIQAASNNVSFIDSKGGVYNAHLYTNVARASGIYTYFPDVNGNFLVKNLNAENNELEADYAWVYFSFSAPAYFGKSDIYVTGMFNNFALTTENKMEYNQKKAIYEKAIMIKQGFTNYQYTIADAKGVVDDENNLDGNFWQTENNYSILVYYRENGQRYDRIIGKGIANSIDIIN